jgi:hypothetical protein
MSDYKEMPCRRCGRVWKWALDKKSDPCCPQGYGCMVDGPTTRELFDEIMKRLDNIEMKISRISPVQPVYPTRPTAPSLGPTICSKCGMKWEGIMGYNCYLIDCPVQPKVTSQTYNVSYTTGNFDIESLDPAERTWYYDGDGTKRKKE